MSLPDTPVKVYETLLPSRWGTAPRFSVTCKKNRSGPDGTAFYEAWFQLPGSSCRSSKLIHDRRARLVAKLVLLLITGRWHGKVLDKHLNMYIWKVK